MAKKEKNRKTEESTEQMAILTEREFTVARALFWLAFFCVGLFHEIPAYLWGAVAGGFVCFTAVRRGTLRVRGGVCSWCLLGVVGCALLTQIWSVDRGSSLSEFGKLLVCLIGGVLLWQVSDQQRQRLKEDLPLIMGAVVLVGIPAYFLPVLQKYFFADGNRLGSLLQYPNTMALLCLVSLIILFHRAANGRRAWYVFVCAAVLLVGIFLSGSRIVFVLCVLTVLVYLIALKPLRRFLLIGGVVAAAAVGLYLAFTGDFDVVGRFATMLSDNNSLLCRFLYVQDALPMLKDHPLGMGGGGYAALAGSYASGVYGVRYVHNDILQLALDWGIPAMLLFLIAFFRSFWRGNLEHRTVLSVIFAHAFLDFDLQFPAVVLTLLLFADCYSGPVLRLKNAERRFLGGVAAILCAVLFYGGGALLPAQLGYAGVTLTLLPWDTTLRCDILEQTQDVESAQRLAQAVLRRNPYSAEALSAMGTVCFAQGNGADAGAYYLRAIRQQPYEKSLYEQLIRATSKSISDADSAGDYETMAVLMEQIRQAEQVRRTTLQNTSKLGWRVEHKPDLKFSEETEAYIARVCDALNAAQGGGQDGE